MEKTIINMTPHAISMVDQDGNLVCKFEPSGATIRLSAKTERVGEVNGLPLTKTVYGEPEGLPEYQDGTWYIVSAMIKAALPERTDLLVPAEQVRNDAGQIIGCKSLGI